MSKRVLFINQEITPYVPKAEMSVFGQKLPEHFQSKGCEIRTFTPKWGVINERRGQLHEVIRLSGLNICVGGVDHPLLIKVASIPTSRVQVYFIDNDDFFYKRGMERDAEGREYADNGHRAIFFARGVLETVKKLRWAPDVVVCQGWMAAVVPAYMKMAYCDEPCFANTKVVTTLFANRIKGEFTPDTKQSVAFNNVTSETLAAYDDNFDITQLLRLAVDYSDGVCVAEAGVDADIVAYAEGKSLPLLNYSPENTCESYHDFFENL